MDNLLNILNLFNKNQENNKPEEHKQQVPQEILDQYPYGQFPIRYTKPGQENIRKNSENRFSYNNINEENNNHKENNNFDLTTLLPLIQLMSSKENNNSNMLKVLSKILFKDNPEMEKVLDIFQKSNNNNIKNKELKTEEDFPEINKVQISSLKRVDE